MKPAILVARAIFPEVLSRLHQHFEVESNQDDVIFTPAELAQRLAGKAGILATASARIDAALLQQVPELKMVANMAVGYDNIDLPACSAHGVMASNTPDVLNETTADFGWALMMATARRITESEHWLRAGSGINGVTTISWAGSARFHPGNYRYGAYRTGDCAPFHWI
jgi:glyoxylate reductase